VVVGEKGNEVEEKTDAIDERETVATEAELLVSLRD